MKKYYFTLFVLFLFGIGTIRAQYVTIPDANFVIYLNSVVPSAMVGNKMDTTNAAVLSLTRIDVENLGILSISGAQYFKSLITLDCGSGSPSLDSNHITSLPTLPATLDTLICGNNRITSMPNLPAGLILLKCYLNKILSLPTLPATLTYLNCSNNLLSVIPTLPNTLIVLSTDGNATLTNLPTLPGSLVYLSCQYDNLSSLPALPSTINSLACDNNQITSLPTLPAALQYFSCGTNQITSIPALPPRLQQFSCTSNQLTSLPTLPGSLLYLSCDYNQITSLPALPARLLQLICSYNQLTSLPTLPATLQLLWCLNNNIYCFPEFPNTIIDSTNFRIVPNPFTCLPNYVPGMPKAILAYPLCLPGNPNGCSSVYGIFGYTYKDINNDCIRDGGDSNLVNIPMQIYNNSNTLLEQTYSAVNGVYYFPDTGAMYKVVVDTTGMPYKVQCRYPGADSLLTIASLDTNVNFSLTCKSGFDVGVQSVATTGLIFPGIEHDLSVVAGDMSQWYNLDCANGDSGTVQITISGPVTYVKPGVGALTPIVSGDVFTYHIPNYGAINNNTAFNLLLKADTNAKAGDTICVYVTVTPRIDNNPSNNIYQYCYYVINSHDPNNKTVFPVNVAPNYDGWFTYTIHFQNTGNAIARNILIKDTLASNLNAETLQLINYNHPNTTYVKGNIVTFQFPEINLPDSAANSMGSIGFVQYRVKPKVNLPNGTTIKNTGYIYFDYNAAIITNTTVNLFTKTLTSVNTVVADITCKVFPNPNNGLFTVSLQGMQNQSRVLIYNTLGQEVYSSGLHNGNTQINLANKATGVYFYRIITENGILISDGKMIVE